MSVVSSLSFAQLTGLLMFSVCVCADESRKYNVRNLAMFVLILELRKIGLFCFSDILVGAQFWLKDEHCRISLVRLTAAAATELLMYFSRAYM